MVDPIQTPGYLKGQLSDIRQEPDGSVSFSHPDGSTGGNSQESGRVKLDASTAQATFDPAFRAQHPEVVATGQYQPPVVRSVRESIERGLAAKLRDVGSGMTGTFLKNTATAGLLSALAGGAGGAWLAHKSGEPMLRKAMLFALLGGGLGTGAGALVNYHGNKFINDFDTTYGIKKEASVAGALMFDPTLTERQKMILMDAITQLPAQEKSDLNRLVAQASGAGIGVLIAKFLGLRGVLSPMLLSMLGVGVATAMTSPRRSYDILGSPLV